MRCSSPGYSRFETYQQRHLLAGATVYILAWLGGVAGTAAQLTQGHVAACLQLTFLEMPAEQFWLFGLWEEIHRIFDLRGLVDALLGLSHPTIPYLMLPPHAALLVLAYFAFRAGPACIHYILVLNIELTCLGGGLLPQVGGHLLTGYLGLYLSRDHVPVFRRLAGHRPAPPGIPQRFGEITASGAAAGTMVVLPMALVIVLHGFFALKVYNPELPERLYVEVLGARVDARIRDKLAFLRAFRAEVRTRDIPLRVRVFSEYLSVVDIIAGTSAPAPADSVIYTVGPPCRQVT